MEDLPKRLTVYFEEALGASLEMHPWRRSLPHFLRHAYDYGVAEVLGAKLLFVFDDADEERAPSVIRKHISQMRANEEGIDGVVYVPRRVSAYNRSRMVKQGLPFVVPGNQMYLPTIGIDFREHFRRSRPEPARLSPSAQVLLIHMLLHRTDSRITPKQAGITLGYSPMTMTRAFDELEAAKLAISQSHGRTRPLGLIAPPGETWQLALSYLRSPIKRRSVIQRNSALDAAPIAGLSALAEYTMMAHPRRPTRALSQEAWQKVRVSLDTTSIPQQDPDAITIEVWSYSPSVISHRECVDHLSLFLSLRDSEDERVTAALDELLEQVAW
ncbi:MAG: hypothetical protein JJ896_15005 [Rhodothermales bacterium]|nr:hypothetical protein [Rhodothermales bacterium]MBO6780961.1 hypothetical protein [Rhodothermales bacterium]